MTATWLLTGKWCRGATTTRDNRCSSAVPPPSTVARSGASRTHTTSKRWRTTASNRFPDRASSSETSRHAPAATASSKPNSKRGRVAFCSQPPRAARGGGCARSTSARRTTTLPAEPAGRRSKLRSAVATASAVATGKMARPWPAKSDPSTQAASAKTSQAADAQRAPTPRTRTFSRTRASLRNVRGWPAKTTATRSGALARAHAAASTTARQHMADSAVHHR
mmetsp:Transcript_32118/g.109075  ORF Transcript_32118/g.109075 Transcript_32118/m.109075 type:complete len:223 (-) Transcript_32118:1079-1747(-)